MATIDVFNGDADGICALLQLRLTEPQKSTLVTGVKRDIQLLGRVDAKAGDRVNVLDISMARNHADLLRLLHNGAELFYVDHHIPGDIPDHPGLRAIIDTNPETCTSLLIDHYLNGRYRAWAITAAFGDNLIDTAEALGGSMGYSPGHLDQLRMLGICLNYNGYGERVEDLHIAPDALFLSLINYQDPAEFVTDPASDYTRLHHGYLDDLARADGTIADYATDAVAVYVLPDQPWSRRVSGVYANQLANSFPERAHAVLTQNQQGGYQVSVRAPLMNRTGADEVCSQFPSGGGRRGAAGINHLPQADYQHLMAVLQSMYRKK